MPTKLPILFASELHCMLKTLLKKESSYAALRVQTSVPVDKTTGL